MRLLSIKRIATRMYADFAAQLALTPAAVWLPAMRGFYNPL
ncbi:hypothetical protein ACFLXC_05050 [Chloroflexota bacterium]